MYRLRSYTVGMVVDASIPNPPAFDTDASSAGVARYAIGLAITGYLILLSLF